MTFIGKLLEQNNVEVCEGHWRDFQAARAGGHGWLGSVGKMIGGAAKDFSGSMNKAYDAAYDPDNPTANFDVNRDSEDSSIDKDSVWGKLGGMLGDWRNPEKRYDTIQRNAMPTIAKIQRQQAKNMLKNAKGVNKMLGKVYSRGNLRRMGKFNPYGYFSTGVMPVYEEETRMGRLARINGIELDEMRLSMRNALSGDTVAHRIFGRIDKPEIIAIPEKPVSLELEKPKEPIVHLGTGVPFNAETGDIELGVPPAEEVVIQTVPEVQAPVPSPISPAKKKSAPSWFDDKIRYGGQ
jgi:hypothetical protein